MTEPGIQYRILDDFDDPAITPEKWNALTDKSPVNEIFLTWEWQHTWWESFGRGKLLLIAAEESGHLIAMAPLFADSGMLFFVGSGGSDYLDFIGDITRPGILENFLSIAANETPGFCGFRFYHIPDGSPTANQLRKETISGKWTLYDEGSLPAPYLDMQKFPEQARLATLKKSLVRHEKWFSKSGSLEVSHYVKNEDISPWLGTFFRQHISRWSVTGYPSLFESESQCLFYTRLSKNLSGTDFLHFTVIQWQGKPIAFHFGFWYHRKFLWYKPSFEIEWAKHSPGEVLIRQLMLQAIQTEAAIFDFGLGDESFKNRFASGTQMVKTWGLYSKNN